MTPQEHKDRHIFLHKCLDELLSDFIFHTGKLPSRSTVLDLLTWSSNQLQFPDDKRHNGGHDNENPSPT